VLPKENVDHPGTHVAAGIPAATPAFLILKNVVRGIPTLSFSTKVQSASIDVSTGIAVASVKPHPLAINKPNTIDD